MKLSAYITSLQALRAQHGDAEVQPRPLEVNGRQVLFGGNKGCAETHPVPESKPESPLSETRRRLDICQGCPHRKPFHIPLTQSEIGKCDVCGCIIELKARLFMEKCPLGEWEPAIHSSGD